MLPTELETTLRPRRKTQRPRRRWRAQPLSVIAGILAWTGMVIILYPTIAAWFSQYNQSQLVDTYSTQVAEGLTPTAAEQLRQAAAYNEALSSGAVLEAGERLPTGEGSSSDESLDYWGLLRAEPLDVMARLRIPSIDVDLPIYHGTADDTLERGAGHLQGTSLPVGGIDTHAVLTAHRGLANATMFTNLDRVNVGETFTVEALGEVLSYKVSSTVVVNPEDTESLRPIRGKDMLTLVTCTPLGVNTQRILVTAERISPTPASDIAEKGTRPEIPGFAWWAVILAVGTVGVVGYVVHSGWQTPPTAAPPAKPGRRRSPVSK